MKPTINSRKKSQKCLQDCMRNWASSFTTKTCRRDTQFNNSHGWNLMARHFNVDELRAQHYGFAVDAMTVEYAKTKMQGKGGVTNMTSMVKHLYANPFKPWVSTLPSKPYFYATFLRHI